MIRGLHIPLVRPAKAHAVHAATAAPTVSFTSGTITSLTFGFANLTKGVTYNVQILLGKTPLTVTSSSGGTGGTLSGTGTANLFLVVPAGSGLATVTGLTIVKSFSADQTGISVRYKLTTDPDTKYKTLTTKWGYDHKYGEGWIGLPLKDTVVIGNESVSNDLIVSNKLTVYNDLIAGALFATTATTNLVTANTDVVINGVSLFTALSSYFLPPAPKKYAPYLQYMTTQLQSGYVALTTDPVGNLYGLTNSGQICSIVITNTPQSLAVGYFSGAVETVLIDLSNSTVIDYNTSAPLAYHGQQFVSFCFDTNPTTAEQGGGFYVLDQNTVLWVSIGTEGEPSTGTYLFGPTDDGTPSNAITVNADSTELYLAGAPVAGTSVTIWAADPYSPSPDNAFGAGTAYAAQPVVLYEDQGAKYDGFSGDDIAFNKTNGLLYLTLTNTNSGADVDIAGYTVSLTTRGVIVQSVTNSAIHNMRHSYAIAVDSTGAIVTVGATASSAGVVNVVPANFIAVPSVYSVTTTTPLQFYSVACGSNGVIYVNDNSDNAIIQLIPS